MVAAGAFAAGNVTLPVPLSGAHAHNDYEHARPLFDALDHGFGSIEADVYLVDGQLLVAHDRAAVKPDRTLESLYLDPLRARVRENGGRVYCGGPTITLLVDVKSDAAPTYAALHTVLTRYADLLTVLRSVGDVATTTPGAITVIVSGNRAPTAMLAQPVRYAALDGRIEDLAGAASSAFISWISDHWEKVLRGPGPALCPRPSAKNSRASSPKRMRRTAVSAFGIHPIAPTPGGCSATPASI